MSDVRKRLLGSLLLSGVGLGVLVGFGDGSLGLPRLGSWHDLEAWHESLGPAAAAMTIARAGAAVGAVWVFAAAGLQLVATVPAGRSLSGFADLVSPRVVQRAAHLSLVAGLALPAPVGDPPADPPGIAVMEVLEDEPDSSATPSTESPVTPPPPTTTTTLPATTTSTTGPPGPTRAPTQPTAPPSAAPAAPAGNAVVVRPGDSFWSIAAEVVAERHGGTATDGQIHDYWRRLVDVNRSRLVDPRNPDLIFAGQRLVLPAP